MRSLTTALLLAVTVLAGCGSTPPAPDWMDNAQTALENYEKTYLAGNSMAADLSFARARSEAARTGQPAWVARIELARCATRAAALEFDDCPAYVALADNAGPEEKGYAAFLLGDWTTVDAKSLPSRYAAVVKEGAGADLGRIEDPLSRLVAAGVLFRKSEITPAGISTAVDTASERGWRRPLLAWLGVQLKRADAAGDTAAAALLRQRIGLVESSLPH